MAEILVTTEPHPDLAIARRLGVVGGECVVGLNALRDIAALLKDITGKRLETAEAKYREAREVVLGQLRERAAALGADAVIAVQFTHGELTGGEKAMLTCVAVGTAVKLAAPPRP
ncbi:MAG TPA: heavy metal-binding domain-containing protein [Planctomycetota bacterium]|nr:heavy metal-binding domain-containing protein [Planctomycetota bacterium]